MKRILVLSVLFGTVGGIIRDLRAPLILHFYPSGNELFVGVLLYFIFESLFAAFVLITGCIAKRPTHVFARVVVFSCLIGTVLSITKIPVNFPFLLTRLMQAVFIGCSAGLIWSSSEQSSRTRFYAAAAGIAGGIVSLLLLHGQFISTFTFTIYQVIRHDFHFSVFATLLDSVVRGGFFSVSIWLFITYVDRRKYFLREKS